MQKNHQCPTINHIAINRCIPVQSSHPRIVPPYATDMYPLSGLSISVSQQLLTTHCQLLTH